MPIDATIPLGFKPTDPMQSLKGLLDVQQSTLNYNKSRDTYDAEVLQKKAEASSAVSKSSNDAINAGEKQSLQKALADPSQFTSPDGTVDFNKLLPLAMRVAPTTGMEHVKSILAAQTASTEGKAKLMDMSAGARAYLSRAAYAMKGQPPDVINKGLDALAEQSPELKDSLPWLQKSMTSVFKSGGQQGLDEALDRTGKGLLDVPAQQTANTPNVATINNGAQTYGINVKPGVQGMPQYGVVPGLGSTAQPPPTTAVLGPDGKTPGIIGASTTPAPGQFGASSASGPITQNERQQAQAESNAARNDLASQIQPRQSERAQAVAEGNTANINSLDREMGRLQGQGNTGGRTAPATSGFMATGMAPGRADSIAATQKGINEHYRGLQDGAANAAQDIGVLQNIISHAKGASTGVGSEKTALAQAIFGRLGITKAQESTLDYDLLGKNAAMIQLAGGDTNLAKTLAGAANPNSHMSEEAIRQAAHQIIGQKKMSLEGLKLFTPLKALSDGGHMEAYGSMLPKYLANADPRVLQLSGMSDAEKSKMKEGMKTVAEQKAFGEKIRVLKSMGIEP